MTMSLGLFILLFLIEFLCGGKKSKNCASEIVLIEMKALVSNQYRIN